MTFRVEITLNSITYSITSQDLLGKASASWCPSQSDLFDSLLLSQIPLLYSFPVVRAKPRIKSEETLVKSSRVSRSVPQLRLHSLYDKTNPKVFQLASASGCSTASRNRTSWPREKGLREV
jgi:hypothetical protein